MNFEFTGKKPNFCIDKCTVLIIISVHNTIFFSYKKIEFSYKFE